MPTNVFGKGGGGVETLQQVTDAGNLITRTDVITGAGYHAAIEKHMFPASNSNLFTGIDMYNDHAQGHVSGELKVEATGVTLSGATITFNNPNINLVTTFNDYQSTLYTLIPVKMYNILVQLPPTGLDAGLYMVVDVTDDGVGGTNNVATVITMDGQTPNFVGAIDTANIFQVVDATNLTIMGLIKMPHVAFGNKGNFVGPVSFAFANVPGNITFAEDSIAYAGLNNSAGSPTIGGDNLDPAGSVFGGTGLGSGGPQTTGWVMNMSMPNLTTGGLFNFVVPAALENWIKIVRDSDVATVYSLTPWGIKFDATPNGTLAIEQILNTSNPIRTLDQDGNEAIAGGDSTDGNEFVCEDIIQHTIIAADVSNGYFLQSWVKTSMDLVASINAMLYHPTTLATAINPTDLIITYDGANITCVDNNTMFVENDIITLMVHYQKGLPV